MGNQTFIAEATSCPWCGGEVAIIATDIDGFDQHVVACVAEECGAQGPFRASPELAAGAWSTVAEAAAARMPGGCRRHKVMSVQRFEAAAGELVEAA